MNALQIVSSFGLFRWTIRVRVASKPSIRTWSNSRGEGRVLNVDLVDETVSACVSVSALSTAQFVPNSVCIIIMSRL